MEKNIKNPLYKIKIDIITKYAGNIGYRLKHTDYLTLAEEINNKSKILLSLSTLRRIFSKDNNNLPNITTLNAFAIYLGYDNWKEYCKKNSSGNNITHSNYNKKRTSVRWVLIPISILFLIGICLIIYKLVTHPDTDLDNIEFYYNEYDSTKIPVTITFNYNIKEFKNDSIIFHPLGFLGKGQDDIRLLNPIDTTATYTYLYPGCYYPKLVIDSKIIKQVRINFVTNTWIANIARQGPFYIKYIDDKEIFKNGKLAFSSKVLKKADFPISEIEQTWYQIFKDFNNIDGDSLCFSAKIKNKLLEKSDLSGRIEIDLFFENENIHLLFEDEKTSLKEIGLWVIEKYYSSKKEDLSFLYQNFKEWNKIKCKTGGKQFKLYTNDSLVFQTFFNKNVGKLIGIRFIFNGLGEVDYVRFFNNDNKLLYNDEFD